MIFSSIVDCLRSVWGYIVVVCSGIALFFLYGWKRKQDGREAVRNEQAKETLRHVERSNEIERHVNSMPSGAAERELRERWSRD